MENKIPALLAEQLGLGWEEVLDRSQAFFINDRFLRYAVLPDGHVINIDAKGKRSFAHFRFEDLFNGRIEIQLRK